MTALGRSPTKPKDMLVESLCERAAELQGQMDGLNIASLLKGLVSVGFLNPPEELMQAIEERGVEVVWCAEDAQDALRALSSMGAQAPRLMEVLEAHLSPKGVAGVSS
uniref:Uncharacterized protein n=1 Tax=Hemiselmis andersenii TaxID=464988 RepID=A0A7S1GZ92_HEMAN|mmetsp:Transcript_2874/g.6849  ORF Transcript_2874/g.6849 Transcript_2874/m.6849 type:complete len:108 (+) Transcript_2874:3-326(+)